MLEVCVCEMSDFQLGKWGGWEEIDTQPHRAANQSAGDRCAAGWREGGGDLKLGAVWLPRWGRPTASEKRSVNPSIYFSALDQFIVTKKGKQINAPWLGYSLLLLSQLINWINNSTDGNPVDHQYNAVNESEFWDVFYLFILQNT